MKTKLLVVGILGTIGILTIELIADDRGPSNKSNLGIRFYGVQVRVSDMEQASDFYHRKLGFSLNDTNKARDEDAIKLGAELPFYLVKVKGDNIINFEQESHAKIAFQVNKMLPTIDKLRKNNILIVDSRIYRNGIGIGIRIEDAFGNQHSMVEVQRGEQPTIEQPKIYNVGFNVSDIEKAEAFYTELLGFEVYSRNYLPEALPLKHDDNSFAFMLHFNNQTKNNPSRYDYDSQTVLMFSTPNLDLAIKDLEKIGVNLLFSKPRKRSDHIYVAFEDPFKNVSELIELTP